MQGIHFTVIGALLTIAIAYWLIRYGSNAYAIAGGYSDASGKHPGAVTALGNIPRVFTKDPGMAPNQV